MVEEYFNKDKFYRMDMDEKLLAFTIYNANIFLNKKYIDIAIDKKNKKSISALAIILTTICHEFVHFLIRVLSIKQNENNYFVSTKNRNKIKKSLKLNESGEYFETLLFGCYTGFYDIDSNFILNLKNYNVSYNIFLKNFKDNYDQNFAKLNNDSFLKKGINEDNEDSSFLLKPKCFWSIKRE